MWDYVRVVYQPRKGQLTMTSSNQEPGIFIQLPENFNLLDLNSQTWENSKKTDLPKPRFKLTMTLTNHGNCRGFHPLVKSIMNTSHDKCQRLTTSLQQEVTSLQQGVFTLEVTSPSAEIVLAVIGLVSASGKNSFNGDDFTLNGHKECSAHIVLTQEQ